MIFFIIDTKVFYWVYREWPKNRRLPCWPASKNPANTSSCSSLKTKKEKGKVKQRVIGTIGRMDRLQAKDKVEMLVRSLSRFSEKTLFVLSGNSEVLADAKKSGTGLIFERLWEQTGIKDAIRKSLKGRNFGFGVERALFLSVLHRLMVSGSDRFCDRWKSDYVIEGVQDLSLHHLYRAMAFIGEAAARAWVTGAITRIIVPI